MVGRVKYLTELHTCPSRLPNGEGKIKVMEKFSKNFKGGDNFLLITGGEISFSTTCPRQVLEKIFWDFEKGGGEEQEKLLKNQKGGGKNCCGQGSKWGRKIFFGIFKGGEKFFPRHVHNARTRMS